MKKIAELIAKATAKDNPWISPMDRELNNELLLYYNLNNKY